MGLPDLSSAGADVDIAGVNVVGSTVVVAGELDMFSSPRLAAVIDAVVIHGRPVRVDLGAVTFMDVAGLRALWPGAGAAGGADCVEVVVASAAVQRVFDLVSVVTRSVEWADERWHLCVVDDGARIESGGFAGRDEGQ